MWGDSLRQWFDLFHTIMVYRGGEPTHGPDIGWLTVEDIEGRFRREAFTYEGKPYDPTDERQKEKLYDAILSHASALCSVKLLERRRQMASPMLSYRVTPSGRKVGNWQTRKGASVRKRAVFFAIAVYFRVQRYWKVIALGAAGLTLINAVKFYGIAWEWIRNDVFAAMSALFVAAAVAAAVWLKAH
jgi:hypothetical protein